MTNAIERSRSMTKQTHQRRLLVSALIFLSLLLLSASAKANTLPNEHGPSEYYNDSNSNASGDMEDAILKMHIPLPSGWTMESLMDSYYNFNDVSAFADATSSDRRLAIGDFESLNQFLEGSFVALPATSLGSDGLEISIVNFYCSDIVLGDFVTNYTKTTTSQGEDALSYTIQAFPFDMNCYADYKYNVGFLFQGSGTLEAITLANDVTVTIDLISPSTFDQQPPNRAKLQSCNTVIRTDGRVNFTNSVLARILNLFRGLISDAIDTNAASLVCGKLSEQGDELFANIFNATQTTLNQWLPPLNATWTNPLLAEESYVVPDGVMLLDFEANSNNDNTIMDNTTSVGGLLVSFLEEADSLFGDPVIDELTGESILGINSFLRENVLNDDGVLVLQMDDLDSTGNLDGALEDATSLFDSEDILTNTQIKMDGLRLKGLDTLQTFEPFVIRGKHTIGNVLAWQSLQLELDLIFDIAPSLREDSILINPNQANRIIERITIAVDFTDLSLDLSLFLAIDENKFDGLILGSMLDTKQIIPCFASAMTDIQLSGLGATVAEFSTPLLTGFLSPGLDRVISQFAEALFVAYKPTLLRAVPGMFQGPLRRMLQDVVVKNFFAVGDESACVPVAPPAGTVDLREFLLKPEEALVLGAAGEKAYGNVGALLYGLAQTSLTELDDAGMPLINQRIIRPMTIEQSGVAGTFVMKDSLFQYGMDDKRRSLQVDEGSFPFNISLGNLRISNMDTIVAPLDLLELTDSPTVLRNTISLGNTVSNSTKRPLTFSFAVAVGMGKTSWTELDMSLSIDSLGLSADVGANVDSEQLFNLPLSSLLEFRCWLTALQSVELNSDGVAVNPTAPRGLSLVDFTASLSSLQLETTCLDCQDAGTILLPELMQIIKETGSVDLLGKQLPELMESVLMGGGGIQTTLDRLIADSPRYCPSNPSYVGKDAVPTEYEFFDFPALSAQSIDTILFTAILVAESGFVMFAETQRLTDIETTSPLSAQEAFDPPSGIRLIDWTNIGNSTGIGAVADQIFDDARGFLSGDSENSLIDLESILGNIVDEDGVLDLEIDLAFELEDFVVAIDSIRVYGLENLKLFDVFEPIGPQTLTASLHFDMLDLEIVFSANTPSTTAPPQVITTRFVVNDVNADIAIFAAFDLDKIAALQLGSLLNTKTLLPCFMSTAYEFELPQMKVSIGSFTAPKIEGLLPATNEVTDQLTEVLFDRFRLNIEEAIPKIFDGIGRDLIASLLTYTDESVCAQQDSKVDDFIDFRDLLLPAELAKSLGGTGEEPYGTLLSSVFDIFKKEFFVANSVTGLAAINDKLITYFTESQSDVPGRLFFPGSIFNSQSNVDVGGFNADVAIRASDFFVNNLDTFGVPWTLLDPINGQQYLLNNSATVGLSHPFEIGLRFFLGLYSKDSESIENDVVLSLDMDVLHVLFKAFIQVSETSFMNFPLADIGNLDCWIATIPAPELDARGVMSDGQLESLALSEFMAKAEKIGMNLTCIDCSGPKLLEMSSLLASQIDGESTDLTFVVNYLLEMVTELVGGDFLQIVGGRALNDARKKCPHNPDYDPDFVRMDYQPFEVKAEEENLAFYIALIIIGVILLFLSFVVILTTKLVVRRRHRKWIAELPNSQVEALWKQQQDESEKKAILNASTDSMFRSEAIPYWLRLTMPVVILGNIGLFLSGHLSLGASVSILLQVGGQTFRTDNFYEFAMASSTIEIWNAGGKELALLIFFFSFAWPYTKQILTLVIWFAPTKKLSVNTRGSTLLWLDALAKWSMVDIFVLVVTIVAFRVSIKSPDVDFLPADLYQIDLMVIPKWGLYANMIAQLISQISSHVIIHYHRRIIQYASDDDKAVISTEHIDYADTALVESDDDFDTEIGEDRNYPKTLDNDIVTSVDYAQDRLSQHSFRRPHRGESDTLVVGRYVSPLLFAMTVVLVILVILGCVLPSYALNALGVVGFLIETGQSFVAANTEFSVITSMQLFFEQARLTGSLKDYIGLGSLTILLVMTVMVVPVVQSITLLIQWFAPLTTKRRYRLSLMLEYLQAWQYAEVYLLSLLVGSWQLGPLSEFMINPYCESLKSLFAELVYYGLLKSEDAQCFKADVNLVPTFYILFVGALLLAFINLFVMKAVSQYNRDCESKANSMCPHRHHGFNDSEEEIATSAEKPIIDLSLVHPTPVLFTDLFRWLLSRDDTKFPRRSLDEQTSVVVTDDVEIKAVINEGDKTGCLEPPLSCEAKYMHQATSGSIRYSDGSSDTPLKISDDTEFGLDVSQGRVNL